MTGWWYIQNLRNNITETLHLLFSLGLCVNHKKSHLVPPRLVQFIRAILDLTVARPFLPPSRVTVLVLVQYPWKNPHTTAVVVQSLLGLKAATTSVIAFSRLCMKILQLWFLRVFNPLCHSQHKVLLLSSHVLDSLHWWETESNSQEGAPFQPPSLTTDTSLWGWDIHLQGFCVRAWWDAQCMAAHINLLEHLVIQFPHQSFLPFLRRKMDSILTDNLTALTYINHEEGTVAFMLPGDRPMGMVCFSWHFSSHYPSSQHPNRPNQWGPSSPHKWKLNWTYLKPVFQRWGQPLVDVFVTHHNRKCHQFCCRGGDDSCTHEVHWGRTLVPMEPPVSLHVPPTPTYKDSQQTKDSPACILITPWWPWQLHFLLRTPFPPPPASSSSTVFPTWNSQYGG